MKSLKKINLSNLSKDELEKRELNHLLGGENCCICNCASSSTVGNGTGNNAINSNWQAGYGSGSFSGH